MPDIAPPTIAARIRLDAELPDFLYQDLVNAATKKIGEAAASLGLEDPTEFMAQPSKAQPVCITAPHPLSWTQVKSLSNGLTDQLSYPVIVLPRGSKEAPFPGVRKTAYSGQYCIFEAQVVFSKINEEKAVLFDLVEVNHHYKTPKDGDPEFQGFILSFPGDPKKKGTYKPDNSFQTGRHIYFGIATELEFDLISDEKLELGATYVFGGLIFSAAPQSNKNPVKYKQNYVLVDWAVPKRNTLALTQGFFDRFKGLPHEVFRDSVAFPFENSVSDYKEILFHQIFHIKTNYIPPNVLLIGNPGCTKSAFLKRLAAISGDKYVDAASSTMKGILPSFSQKNLSPGAMATAKFFACINEFFNIVRKGANGKGDEYDVLSMLKTLLEGEKYTAQSGNGNMDIIMRGSAVLATNWPSNYGARMTTPQQLYAKIDSALLDRVLIYPVPQKLQSIFKSDFEMEVKNRMSRFKKETHISNDIEILEKLPSPFPLSTYDFRTLLFFKENLTVECSQQAMDSIKVWEKKIQAIYGWDIFTRSQDFIVNFASAYAFEQALREGKVAPETVSIQIEEPHIREAASYYLAVLLRHSGKEESGLGRRKEFFENFATPPQKFIIGELKARYESNSGDARMMKLDSLSDLFASKYPEASWNLAIRSLIGEKVVVWDGDNLMWLPDKLEDAALSALTLGGEALNPFISGLLELNLVRTVEGGLSLGSPWKFTLPTEPELGTQNLVREQIRAGAGKPVDIDAIANTANRAQVESALSYFHLAGEVWHLPEGYLLKPERQK
jgi:hypothetical protein